MVQVQFDPTQGHRSAIREVELNRLLVDHAGFNASDLACLVEFGRVGRLSMLAHGKGRALRPPSGQNVGCAEISIRNPQLPWPSLVEESRHQRAFLAVAIFTRDQVNDDARIWVVNDQRQTWQRATAEWAQGREPFLSGWQVTAIQHENAIPRTYGRFCGADLLQYRSEPLGTTSHQRPGKAGLRAIDLVVERRQ